MSIYRSKIFNPKSKRVPIIVVPGFLTAKDEQWGSFVANTTGHPVHLLNWESFSNSDFFLQFLKTGIFALTSPVTLWVKAIKECDKVIFSMLNYISENFSDSPFILLGHSLGGRIVSEMTLTINSVDELRNQNLLSTIIIAGAINSFDVEITDYSSDDTPSMGYINFFSPNDKVLSKLYRTATTYNETPAGIVSVEGRRIINKQTTLGHTDYLNNQSFRQELNRCIYAIQTLYENEVHPSQPLVLG